jgi:hypothetical protein
MGADGGGAYEGEKSGEDRNGDIAHYCQDPPLLRTSISIQGTYLYLAHKLYSTVRYGMRHFSFYPRVVNVATPYRRICTAAKMCAHT